MYSAASALDMATLNQEVVAENLANANSPGYRRQGVVFEHVRQRAQGSEASPAGKVGGTQSSTVYTDFEQGPLQETGNSLDLALTKNVFFVLDGPNGPLYTRNGAFQLDSQGQLLSRSGLPVRSGGGRITVPANTSRITVNADGAVLADNNEIGRLQLAEFSDPRQLQRAGTSLFQGPAGRQPDVGTYRVQQGYREGSNVQVVNEMVSMMSGMRQYEAAQKALRALGDALSLSTKPQG